MGAMYWPAPELAKRAQPIIKQHHSHLLGVEPLWVWREKASKSKGKVTLGKARRLTGLNAALVGAFDSGNGDFYAEDYPETGDRFVIEIARDTWDELDRDQRTALLDHELCHCLTDTDDETGQLILKLVSHDVEEFEAIVRRHGLWEPDLSSFGAAVAESAQLRLIPDEGAA